MTTAPKRFVDHVALWMRWRWFLIGVVFFAALLAAVISTLMPKIYRATSVVLPPFEGGTALPFLGGVTVDIFGANEVPTSGLATLLKSRALKDRVHQRIDLLEHYQKPDLEKAYQAFENNLQVEFESEESFGAVTIIAFRIHILDRDAQFCAKLLNVAIEEWDGLCIEMNRRSAMLRRQFVEENLRKTAAELAANEDTLRAFQEMHGIAEIQAQVQGTISTAVALEQKITETRIIVAVLDKLYQPGHPLLQRATLELQGLLQEKKKMQEFQGKDQFLLPLGQAPELSLSYARLFRQVKMLEAVSDVLIQQFEQAKIQEMKTTPALRIVDRAEVPAHKFKPRRMLLSLIAGLAALFLAAVAMYFLDYVHRIRGTEESRWIEEISNYLKADVQRIRRWVRWGGN